MNTNTSLQAPAHIFRAYDIRGVVENELTEAVVFAIGQAFGSEALASGVQSLAVGRDGRLSGPVLVEALKQGILASGCDVIDIGMVPTPVLYFATHVLETDSGVMLTGSHNPVNYNGLKMVLQGKALSTEGIQTLYRRIEQQQFHHGQGSLRSENLLPQYLEVVTAQVSIRKPLKVIVDCGNGVPAVVGPELYRQLGCQVETLYGDVDGSFPNHHPDPSKEKNLQDLIAAVKHSGADVGLAFDGDGDRLGVVTPKGQVIWPDRQMMFYAKNVLKQHPGGIVIYDVKCSKNLAKVIEQAGGKPQMNCTGHSLIKAEMRRVNAVLAGEMSGHICFNDHWYGFDDGVYTGARFLEMLAEDGRTVDEIFAEIPDSYATPELNISVADDKKFEVVAQMVDAAKTAFPEADLITIDGLRVEFPYGWALVRASNTTPCLVLRYEADSEEDLQRIQQQFSEFLHSFGL